MNDITQLRYHTRGHTRDNSRDDTSDQTRDHTKGTQRTVQGTMQETTRGYIPRKLMPMLVNGTCHFNIIVKHENDSCETKFYKKFKFADRSTHLCDVIKSISQKGSDGFPLTTTILLAVP